MCDCELPAVSKEGFVKARKSHVCGECRNPIDIGEEYWKIRGLWEDQWATYKMCKSCRDLAEELRCEDRCFCFGEVIYEAEECGLIERKKHG